MTFINVTKSMNSFYEDTFLPMLIPVAGPLVISTFVGIIALIDSVVSAIFKCTQNLTEKEKEKIDLHFNALQTTLKHHGINFITLGIYPWILVIQEACCQN